MTAPVYEQHSADFQTYIARREEGKWEVWVRGKLEEVHQTREAARVAIRKLKKEAAGP